MDSWQPLSGIGLSRQSALLGLDLTARPSLHTRLHLGYEYLQGDRGQAGVLRADFQTTF